MHVHIFTLINTHTLHTCTRNTHTTHLRVSDHSCAHYVLHFLLNKSRGGAEEGALEPQLLELQARHLEFGREVFEGDGTDRGVLLGLCVCVCVCIDRVIEMYKYPHTTYTCSYSRSYHIRTTLHYPTLPYTALHTCLRASSCTTHSFRLAFARSARSLVRVLIAFALSLRDIVPIFPTARTYLNIPYCNMCVYVCSI
jgi:hypothetical protein